LTLARSRRAGSRSSGSPAFSAPDVPAAAGDTPDTAGVGGLSEELAARLRAQFPRADRADGRPLLMAAMLRIERRPAALRRLIGVWAVEAGEAGAAGDFASVEAWLRALSDHRVSSEDEAELVKGAISSVLGPEVLEGLAWRLASERGSASGEGFPKVVVEPLMRHLVEGLAGPDLVRRRRLVDLLAAVGRMDIRLAASGVAEAGPVALRGVAAALGRTGRPEAVPVLESLTAHSNRRVRVAALAGLVSLRGGDAVPTLAAALDDPEYLVRACAISLLRRCPGPEAAGVLVGFLGTGGPFPSAAVRAVDIALERSGSKVPIEPQRLVGRSGPVGRIISSLGRCGAW
jgi:hypothetical protein